MQLRHTPSCSRRVALSVLGGLGAALALSACSSPAPPVTVPPVPRDVVGSPGRPVPTAAAAAPDRILPSPQPGSATTPKPTVGRRLASHLNVAQPVLADSLDPFSNIGPPSFTAYRQIFDALVTFDDSGTRLEPQLAASWRRIDPLTMEFKLRDDVKFSNGEAFTAATVEYNVQRLVNSTNPIHASTKARMGPLAGAEVVDSTTVRIKTRHPDPILLNRLTMLFLMPERFGRSGLDVGTRPVGTGPFKVTEFNGGNRVSFEAWDGSWRGRSTIQTARIIRLSEPATMLAALKNGEVDMIDTPPPDQLAGLRRDGFKVASFDGGTCSMINIIPGNSRFDSRVAREALNLAIDKDELLKTVQAGLGRVLPGQLLAKGMAGYRDDLRAIPYDPERARALIRQAGLEGETITISNHVEAQYLAIAIAGYWNAIGVRTRVETLEPSVILQLLTRPHGRPALARTVPFYQVRDWDIVGLRFTRHETPQPHFANAEFDRLWVAAREEMDERRRGEQIGQMQGLLREEFGLVYLLFLDVATAFTPKIAGLDRTYDRTYRFWKIEKEA